MDNPEPSEVEHEQAGTQRHREEEDMRGADRSDLDAGDREQPEENGEEGGET